MILDISNLKRIVSEQECEARATLEKKNCEVRELPLRRLGAVQSALHRKNVIWVSSLEEEE